MASKIIYIYTLIYLPVIRDVSILNGRLGLGQSKVNDVELTRIIAASNYEVVWLDVAVNEVLAVEELKPATCQDPSAPVVLKHWNIEAQDETLKRESRVFREVPLQASNMGLVIIWSASIKVVFKEKRLPHMRKRSSIYSFNAALKFWSVAISGHRWSTCLPKQSVLGG